MLILRNYTAADSAETAVLFYETVHAVNRRDYTKKQLDAWASAVPDLNEWNRSFDGHIGIVAVSDGKIVGFGDITPSGYLDRLYVHKDFQRRGIAAEICNVLEAAADAEKITVHASITAKPFFEHRGYRAVKEQQVIRHGVKLTNYVMENETAATARQR